MEHKDKPSGRASDVRSAFARKARIVAASSDLDPRAREFAEQQIFSPAASVKPSSGPPRSLDQVVAELHDSEINVGMQSFCFCGMRVWIGDPLNGIEAQASFGPGDKTWMIDGSIARWLHDTALRLYPESAYATRQGKAA